MLLLIIIGIIAATLFCIPALAQDHSGHHGQGHSTWHEGFYKSLIRKDTRASCCNLNDCRPTLSRMVDDHYEVLLDGEWVPVPHDSIQNVTAPDGGAHVCALKSNTSSKAKPHCVVLPPEG